jgi:hypothetical protein
MSGDREDSRPTASVSAGAFWIIRLSPGRPLRAMPARAEPIRRKGVSVRKFQKGEHMRLRREGIHTTDRGRRLGVILATAGLLGLSLTGTVVTASAANATTYYRLFNIETTMCLTSGGGSDVAAEEYSCDGSANQLWYWGSERGSTGYYQFKNDATGQCLSVYYASLKAGQGLDVWSCGASAAMYWQVDPDYPFSPDALLFINANSGDVMQVRCDCAKDSAPLDQEPYDDLGNPIQFWSYG